MAITKHPSVTLSADGRALLRSLGQSGTRNEMTVALFGSFGGGTVSLQISFEDSPVLATDAHWATIDGASSLSVLTAYRIEIAGAAIAVRITGSTTPSLTVAWA